MKFNHEKLPKGQSVPDSVSLTPYAPVTTLRWCLEQAVFQNYHSTKTLLRVLTKHKLAKSTILTSTFLYVNPRKNSMIGWRV